jgi:hypothetical protein
VTYESPKVEELGTLEDLTRNNGKRGAHVDGNSHSCGNNGLGNPLCVS